MVGTPEILECKMDPKKTPQKKTLNLTIKSLENKTAPTKVVAAAGSPVVGCT